jgi:hypothetical protein
VVRFSVVRAGWSVRGGDVVENAPEALDRSCRRDSRSPKIASGDFRDDERRRRRLSNHVRFLAPLGRVLASSGRRRTASPFESAEGTTFPRAAGEREAFAASRKSPISEGLVRSLRSLTRTPGPQSHASPADSFAPSLRSVAQSSLARWRAHMERGAVRAPNLTLPRGQADRITVSWRNERASALVAVPATQAPQLRERSGRSEERSEPRRNERARAFFPFS